MKIPMCTDVMIEKVLGAAASPVAILWEETDGLGYRNNRTVTQFAADEYDDRVIFLACSIDENPSAAEKWACPLHGGLTAPGLTIYQNGRLLASLPRAYNLELCKTALEQATVNEPGAPPTP